MDIVKKTNVPLEEALIIAGSGWYTRCVLCVSGLVVFTGFTLVQAMSVIIPAAGCDLKITSFQKGILTSVGYTGMLFSTHLFGFLADTYGRRKVIFSCTITSGVLIIVSSLAPNAESLMVAYFIIGFVGGGIFASAYVYASEFCQASTRASGLVVSASFTAVANMFLGGLAWLLLPIDLNILLFGGLQYKSWRLFLTVLSLPPFLSAAVIYQFPDTPKYLLNAGKKKETIEILKSIYSVNMGKNREYFPVSSVCLDGQDQENDLNVDAKMSCFQRLRDLIQQTAIAFSPKYILYMLISCGSILVIGGINNVVILWLPEETKKLSHFKDTHTYYNVTLCDVMSSKSEDSNVKECLVNYETYIPNILVGAVQLIFFYLVILIVKIIGAKSLLVLFSSVTAVASVVVIFSNIYYITLLCLGSMAVLLVTMFPVFLSIVVGYFPTSIRSNATSIVLLFGRLCSVIGSQILGAVFYSSCEIAYGVISALVIGNVFLSIFMPIKKP